MRRSSKGVCKHLGSGQFSHYYFVKQRLYILFSGRVKKKSVIRLIYIISNKKSQRIGNRFEYVIYMIYNCRYRPNLKSPERRHGYHVGVFGHRRTRTGRIVGLQTVPYGFDHFLYAAASFLEFWRLHGHRPPPRLAGCPAGVVVDLPPRRLAGAFVLDFLESAVQRQVVTDGVLRMQKHNAPSQRQVYVAMVLGGKQRVQEGTYKCSSRAVYSHPSPSQ